MHYIIATGLGYELREGGGGGGAPQSQRPRREHWAFL